ncbi:SDR family NAD(P)-dependent oxidoreductase [Alkalihalobacterium bogoriense]|uniref:SDR family NAD(P)-dependent oxidoreductase n=1 Tax=Alkalihalobacterium bogoriense TaxID=246272 RepID=UPI000479F056|nr:SDR family oxidoreductase [Alkalihalobacterium bogoriense]
MLNNKIIVITGASSGLGKEIAIEVARNNGIPVLVARRIDKLMELQHFISTEFHVTAPVYELDVCSIDSVRSTFATIFVDMERVDVLINNAGMAVFDDFIDATYEDMTNMVEVNVMGVLACTKAVLPHMLEQNQGHIIMIASQAGKIATPKSSVYAATKHAVLGFTNSLRMELHDSGIEVSAVNPGPIQTPFFDQADRSGTYVKNVEKLMLSPTKVANRIVNLIDKPKRELNLPWWMNVGSVLYQVMPKVVEKIGGKKFYQK